MVQRGSQAVMSPCMAAILPWWTPGPRNHSPGLWAGRGSEHGHSLSLAQVCLFSLAWTNLLQEVLLGNPVGPSWPSIAHTGATRGDGSGWTASHPAYTSYPKMVHEGTSKARGKMELDICVHWCDEDPKPTQNYPSVLLFHGLCEKPLAWEGKVVGLAAESQAPQKALSPPLTFQFHRPLLVLEINFWQAGPSCSAHQPLCSQKVCRTGSACARNTEATPSLLGEDMPSTQGQRGQGLRTPLCPSLQPQIAA